MIKVVIKNLELKPKVNKKVKNIVSQMIRQESWIYISIYSIQVSYKCAIFLIKIREIKRDSCFACINYYLFASEQISCE